MKTLQMLKILIISLVLSSCANDSDPTTTLSPQPLPTMPTVTNGVNGLNGANSVIKQYSAPESLCENGLVIDTFTDINGNNEYDLNIDTNYQRTMLCLKRKKRKHD